MPSSTICPRGFCLQTAGVRLTTPRGASTRAAARRPPGRALRCAARQRWSVPRGCTGGPTSPGSSRDSSIGCWLSAGGYRRYVMRPPRTRTRPALPPRCHRRNFQAITWLSPVTWRCCHDRYTLVIRVFAGLGTSPRAATLCRRAAAYVIMALNLWSRRGRHGQLAVFWCVCVLASRFGFQRRTLRSQSCRCRPCPSRG